MKDLLYLPGAAMTEHENLQILQPLRIPSGWKIAFNNFFMLDPSQYIGSDNVFWENFVEDMLYIVYEWPFKKDEITYTKKLRLI